MTRLPELSTIRARFLLAVGVPSACIAAFGACGEREPARQPEPHPVSVPPPGTNETGEGAVPERSAGNPTAGGEPPDHMHVVGNHVCVTEAGTNPESAKVFAACHAQPDIKVAYRADVGMPCGPCAFDFDQQVTRDQRSAGHPTACCYMTSSPFLGRPLRDGARVIVAEEARRAGWDRGPLSVAVHALRPELRERLAAEWTRDGLAEHASVASFAIFSLELMQLGAPAELVAWAHRAALEEIEHAELCFSLASAYAGAPRGPGRLQVPAPRDPMGDLRALVEQVFVDGCAGETAGAVEARVAARSAVDPVVRTALERIARDEESHAELAWRALAWLLERDLSARSVVERRLAELTQGGSDARAFGERHELAEHGRIDAITRSEVARACLQQVVAPCARALLELSAPEPAARARPA